MATTTRAFELTRLMRRLMPRVPRMRAGTSVAPSALIAAMLTAALWFVATNGVRLPESIGAHSWRASSRSHAVQAIHVIVYCVDGDVRTQRRFASSVDVSLVDDAPRFAFERLAKTPSGAESVRGAASLIACGYDATAPPHSLS